MDTVNCLLTITTISRSGESGRMAALVSCDTENENKLCEMRQEVVVLELVNPKNGELFNVSGLLKTINFGADVKAVMSDCQITEPTLWQLWKSIKKHDFSAKIKMKDAKLI